ncbi:hypothetical protein H5410_021669, partial [Solanum commersonii]
NGPISDYVLGLSNELSLPREEVGKDPGLRKARRAKVLSLKDAVHMAMAQYLSAVEDGSFLSKTLAAGTHWQKKTRKVIKHSRLCKRRANWCMPGTMNEGYEKRVSKVRSNELAGPLVRNGIEIKEKFP